MMIHGWFSELLVVANPRSLLASFYDVPPRRETTQWGSELNTDGRHGDRELELGSTQERFGGSGMLESIEPRRCESRGEDPG
jgi:hypothetical protein